jgi:hypothetical protein
MGKEVVLKRYTIITPNQKEILIKQATIEGQVYKTDPSKWLLRLNNRETLTILVLVDDNLYLIADISNKSLR